MSGFKEMVRDDIRSVFLNVEEFANLHTVIYDGIAYEDVPLVMSGLKEQDRKQLVRDHGDRVQGLYLVTAVVHYAVSDLGGIVPEKGMRIQISDGDFLRRYTVVSSVNEMGMVRVELEAIDE